MTQELITSSRVLLPVAATPLEMRMDETRFPRIYTLTQDGAIRQMRDIVLGAALYSGKKMPKEDIDMTAAALVGEILTDTKYNLRAMCFAEIKRAIRSAVLENEMYGVSVATLYRGLIKYATGEGHAAADQAYRARQLQKRTAAPQVAIDAAAGALVKNNTIK